MQLYVIVSKIVTKKIFYNANRFYAKTCIVFVSVFSIITRIWALQVLICVTRKHRTIAKFNFNQKLFSWKISLQMGYLFFFKLSDFRDSAWKIPNPNILCYYKYKYIV